MIDAERTELIALYDALTALESYTPGPDFDPLAYSLCDFVARPRDFTASQDLLRAFEKDRPAGIETLQHISMTSEALNERHHAKRFLNDPSNSSFEDLYNSYSHDWAKKRALIEKSCLPPTDRPPHILYAGSSTIPFCAYALSLQVNAEIHWIDSHPQDVATANEILARTGNTHINVHHDANYNFASVKDIPPPDCCFILSNVRAPELMAHLAQSGCSRIVTVGGDGMARLLYPAGADLSDFSYTFQRGYLPPHITNHQPAGYSLAPELSFVTLRQYDCS